jgi:hypothetical protein
VVALVAPEAMTVIEIVKLLLYVVMIILALVTGLKSGRAARASTGFGGGRFVSWLVVFVAFAGVLWPERLSSMCGLDWRLPPITPL